VLLGDSGGFQIGKGVIKFDWDRFYEVENDPSTWKGGKYVGAADKLRLSILRWLEHTAEWSMCLDVPTFATNPELRDKTGLRTFEDCLNATLHNNEFFVKHRKPGGTKILNVLQGGDFTEAQIWYDAVKHFPFEGWAFGSAQKANMELALKRIIILRDEGLLAEKDWIHFLGTSRLDWAVMLTSIQRQIRKHINPRLTISFDCASPFIAAANGLTYTDYKHTPDKWTYSMGRCPDSRDLTNSSFPFPFEGEIGKRLKMRDICCYKPGQTNANGKLTTSSWDSFSYLLIMALNVNQHINAVIKANRLVDVESSLYKPNVRDWKKLKGNDKSGELSNWVPRNLLHFNTFIEELFIHPNPMQFIDDHRSFLATFGSNRQSSNSTFNLLFEEEINEADDDAFENPEDDKMNELEQTIDE